MIFPKVIHLGEAKLRHKTVIMFCFKQESYPNSVPAPRFSNRNEYLENTEDLAK